MVQPYHRSQRRTVPLALCKYHVRSKTSNGIMKNHNQFSFQKPNTTSVSHVRLNDRYRSLVSQAQFGVNVSKIPRLIFRVGLKF